MIGEPSRVEAIARALRPALRDKVEAALAYTRSLKEPRTAEHHGAEGQLWGAALDEAGLGLELDGSWSARRIPPASELTTEQRQLAELLASTPGPYLMKHALPAEAWVRRQWLGIDPPGPLFRVEVNGVPLFHAVRAAMKSAEADGSNAAADLLACVDDDERIAALCDLRLASLDAWSSPAEGMLRRELPDLGASGGVWASTFADRPFAECVACVRAVPADRRNAALATALGRVFFDGERAGLARLLLAVYPLPSVAAVVVADIDAVRDTEKALAELREASARDRAVAKIVRPLERRLARRPRLRVVKRVKPIAREGLDALRSKQLEAANAGYGGQRLSVVQIFEAPEDGEIIMPSLTELVLLVDERGKPAYDAWLYMGDSGSIFKAGTTRRVASVIQGSLECKTLALRIALKDALASMAP